MDKGDKLTSNARQSLLDAGSLDEYEEAVTLSDFPRLAEILFNADIPEKDVHLILFNIGKDLNKPLDEMIAERFSGENAKLAKIVAADLSRDVGLRILKCAVYYSRGDLGRLDEMAKLARIDYRDVIVMGEYEPIRGKLVRLRSFV